MYTLGLKRIYETPSASDGARILVDRLWPRGISKDRAQLTLWAKELTPSKDLRRSYHAHELAFNDFAQAYLAELSSNTQAQNFVEQLKALLSHSNVTLVYASKDQQNHAQVLLGWLKNELALN